MIPLAIAPKITSLHIRFSSAWCRPGANLKIITLKIINLLKMFLKSEIKITIEK
jgi:hypothetical protein